MTYRNSNDSAEGSSVGEEVFALTDEQILGMEPELAGEQDAEISPGSLRSVAGVREARTEEKAGHSGRDDRSGLTETKGATPQEVREADGNSAQPRITPQKARRGAESAVLREAPGWLVERMKDPWSGTEAREFWEGAQKAERDAAAYREAFATPEDAKALKELYPGGVADAKGAVERVRQLEEIDAAYFGAAGKAPEELSSARARLAEKLYAQDPEAFREMVAVGMRLVGASGEGSLRSAAQTAHVSGQDDTALKQEGGKEKPAPLSAKGAAPNLGMRGDNNSQLVATAYVEFERAANAELEKSVGGTIGRMLDEALPNLKRMANLGREGQAAPLQGRLAEAVREEIETGLKSDGQLVEQVAKILSGRRFDEAARRQVVRLIDARAQQLAPGAVRRVVGSWTQGTLGGARKAEEAPRREEANTVAERASKERPGTVRNTKKDEVARGTAAGRAVDYGRFSDEQILDL